MVTLEAKYIPNVDDLACSSSTGGGKVVLGFQNIRGLLIITGCTVLIGLGIGMLETIIRVLLFCMPCLGKKGEAIIEALHDAEEHMKEQHDLLRHAKKKDEEDEDSPDAVVDKGIEDLATRLQALEAMLKEVGDPVKPAPKENKEQKATGGSWLASLGVTS